ncbi:hypothetical protein C2S52_018335 [Perilla frutescens var. hirtella]|nr:hypothetical protein C2S52_018335 [Perilla frutescens var. hirtella]
MESVESWERECVMSELNEGIKLANKLKKQLHNINNSSSDCGFLIEKIVSCYDNALALLGYMDSLQTGVSTANLFHFKDDHAFADVPKKRKNLARWSEEVHVCSGLEDRITDALIAVHRDAYRQNKYNEGKMTRVSLRSFTEANTLVF